MHPRLEALERSRLRVIRPIETTLLVKLSKVRALFYFQQKFFRRAFDCLAENIFEVKSNGGAEFNGSQIRVGFSSGRRYFPASVGGLQNKRGAFGGAVFGGAFVADRTVAAPNFRRVRKNVAASTVALCPR